MAAISADPLERLLPMDVTFTNASTGATNYVWYFGDGGNSNASDPVHTYLNPGTVDSVYTARLVASTASGCSDTVNTVITVAPTVLSMFTHDALPGCAPLDVNFTNNSTGATNFQWDFGDGTTSTVNSPSHTYVNQTGVLQVLTVTLAVSNWAGCSSTSQQSITVYPAPNFTFSAQPDSGCTPLLVVFPSPSGR